MSRQAKLLSDAQLSRFEDYIRLESNNPVRDTVLVNLSFRAGLRVGEMAQLRWVDVSDAEGNISVDVINIPSEIVKFTKRNRTIPMHPKVRDALIQLRAMRLDDKYVCNKLYNFRVVDAPMRSNTLTVYLNRLYEKAGFENASSHSGRRSFTTKLARRANVHHCSLHDVQLLVGHASIKTTEKYIGPSDDVSSMIMAEL